MFAKANNGQKFLFIGGIATNIIFLYITVSFFGITVQEITIVDQFPCSFILFLCSFILFRGAISRRRANLLFFGVSGKQFRHYFRRVKHFCPEFEKFSLPVLILPSQGLIFSVQCESLFISGRKKF